MRVLFLTQFYHPEPAKLLSDLTDSLQAAGKEVTVLTGFPNYPSGELYSGYKLKLFQKEEINGITVVRVPLYPYHGKSAIRRIVNYLSFAASAVFLGFWLVPRVDVIHVHHPPLTIGWSARLLGRLLRVPFTYEIQDMWPETLRASGMLNNRCVLGMLAWYAKRVYRRAAAIRVISPGFRKNLIDKGVPSEKIHVISNWVDVDFYRPMEPDAELAQSLGLTNRFNIMFAGTLGIAQELDTVLDAAELLQESPDVQFVLVGDGADAERLRKAAQDRHLRNVKFLGRFPPREMPELYALSDVLLVHLRDDPLFRITIPHKVFSCMASGKPVLAAMEGDAADVVQSAEAGLLCPNSDPRAMADTILRFHAMSPSERQMLGNNGRRAACETYARERLTQQVAEMLESVVAKSKTKSRSRQATSRKDTGGTGIDDRCVSNQDIPIGLKPRQWAQKRALDVLGSGIGLVILSPILLVLALLVWICHGRPVLYRQARPGLRGKLFTVCKFRTMTDARDEAGELLPDSERLTWLGRLLRKSSLDELPELWNVLKGEMSLVGPRPLLREYLPYFTEREQQRHSVRPGITGLAQVSGRNLLDWDDRLELDVQYVENWSTWLDLKILVLTLVHLVHRKGLVVDPGSVMLNLDEARADMIRGRVESKGNHVAGC